MGKHRSAHGSDDLISARMFCAVVVCLVIGVFFVWFGTDRITNPATCELTTMSVNDLCRHSGKGGEDIVVDGARGPQSTLYTLDEQRSHNRAWGPAYLAVGIVLLAGSAVTVTFQVKALRARRRHHE